VETLGQQAGTEAPARAAKFVAALKF